jgi:hypothetical protein
MSLRPDDRSSRLNDTTTGVSPRGRLLRGIAAAVVCDTIFTVPWEVVRPVIRPENIAAAVESLLLGVNMLVGYVGGRAAARAGLAHDDTRAQWTMAWSVALVSLLVQLSTMRLRTGAIQLGAPVMLCVSFTVSMLLVRFGFAMGTWSQARREGRVHDDEDEASAD